MSEHRRNRCSIASMGRQERARKVRAKQNCAMMVRRAKRAKIDEVANVEHSEDITEAPATSQALAEDTTNNDENIVSLIMTDFI